MFCPKCGEQSKYGKFCRSCGTNLEVVSEVITERSMDEIATSSSGGMTLGLFSPATVSNEARDISNHRAISAFGNVTVDLTAMTLPVGETTISAYTIFGNIEVLALNDVGIRITGLTALSSIKVRGEEAHNGFFDADEYTSPNYQEATRRLHIEVAALFATIKIRR